MRNIVSEQQARSILMSSLDSAEEIGRRYGVTGACVRLYKRQRLEKARLAAARLRQQGWTPVLWDDARRAAKRRLSDDQVARIRASKESSAKVAKLYGVSASLIRRIRTGGIYNG